MKVLVLLLILSSCSLIPTSEPIEPHGFETVEEVHAWVYSNIEPTRDIEQFGFYTVREPWQTYEARQGDCLDKALLMEYFIEKEVDISCAVIRGTYNGSPHAWCEIDNQWYDPSYPLFIDVKIYGGTYESN
jgi:hypothetical protein